MLTSVNPLLLPEILGRVSDFVSTWDVVSSYGTPSDYEFYPHDIIACSLVSRTWYNVFYPTLWIVHDGCAMSRVPLSKRLVQDVVNTNNTNINSYNYNTSFASVPEDVLIAQSPRFRIFVDGGSRCTNNITSFKCRQLIDLTLYGACPRAAYLLSMNPDLKRLTWNGAVPFSGMRSELETDTLMALKRGKGKGLESLTLKQWDVSEGRLLRVLQWTCKSLVRLTLKSIQGLDSITLIQDEQAITCGGDVLEAEDAGDMEQVKGLRCMDTAKQPPWGQQLQQQHQQEDEDEKARRRQRDLVLDHLQELTIDCEWPENETLLEFITECCPNLKILDLGDALLDDTDMIARLENVLTRRGILRDKRASAIGMQYRLGGNWRMND